MSISRVYFFVLQASDLDSGDAISVSVTARFDPQTAFAQTALTFVQPADLFNIATYFGIGISHSETRPDPNQPDQSTDLSLDPQFGYPPCLFADQMTVVTAELIVAGQVQATGQMTVYLFD
jgi:hypothetical protein